MTFQPLKQSLSNESTAYLKSRPKSERSPIGQFLTPRVLREALVAQIPFERGMRVLDPGVGTGEFLKTCHDSFENLQLFGWDIDGPVLEVARQLIPYAELQNRSALSPWPGEKFDIVIGNPPYFEMKGIDNDLKSQYREVISGRPNIFSLFFQAGFEVLKEGGYLAYVVPPSMNNGAYFEKLRRFIVGNFSIEYLNVINDPFMFEDVQTAVQLIVLRKGGKSGAFTVDLGELSQSEVSRTIFSDDPKLFDEAFKGRTTLFQLGFKAVTGTVVWNTRKNDLLREPEDGSTPLIWAHNITNHSEVVLNESHPKRPQYIKNVTPQVGPAIVVNRISGSVGRGSIRCALIPAGMKFVAENHVNVILPRSGANALISLDDLLSKLRHNDISKRVQMLTGNTQISATELSNWIPIDK